jgi:hypothetical protein
MAERSVFWKGSKNEERQVMLNARLKTHFNTNPLPQTSGGEGIKDNRLPFCLRVWHFSASLPNFDKIFV